MKITVISHCWAGRFPHYGYALAYQLSSFLLHKPRTCEVVPTVCYNPDDTLTVTCLKFFQEQGLGMRLIPLSMPALGRRCIGRNLAALETDADLVWFTDADWVFGEGCLDALAGWGWPTACSIAYPPYSLVSVDHATGDIATGRMADGFKVADIVPDEFVTKHYNRAIGPTQIVRGEYARQYGYLNDHPMARERDDGNYFGDFRDDIVFRNSCQARGKQMRVLLPNLSRLRHTETTYQ